MGRAQVFDRELPLEIEIGTGKGLFLRTAATDHPERNFLGIEISARYARFAAAKLAKQSLNNARVVHTDAMRVFRELLPDDSLAAVHIYFPDPWWKKRHRKRRVMTEALVSDVRRTLQADGKLHFWTDVREYFEEALAVLVNESGLAGPMDVLLRREEHEPDYRTHFERRMRLNGTPVYRTLFVKN